MPACWSTRAGCLVEPTAMTTEISGTENGIEPRTRRACEKSMVVVPTDADGMFDVWTGFCEEPYVVDLGGEHDRCSCPDMQYNLEDGERCKHAWRVRLEFGLAPYEDVPQLRSEHAAPMDVELARRQRGIDIEPEPEPEVDGVTVADAKPERAVQVATDGGVVLADPDADEDDESKSAAGRVADRDVRLEANRIATEAVAEADGPLADFDVFCLTVEATQDTLLRTLEE